MSKDRSQDLTLVTAQRSELTKLDSARATSKCVGRHNDEREIKFVRAARR